MYWKALYTAKQIKNQIRSQDYAWKKIRAQPKSPNPEFVNIQQFY